MEDLDQDRAQPGAADQIFRALETLGLWWDGEIVRQTERTDRYRAVFEHLHAQGLVYGCDCSRKQAAGRCVGLCANRQSDRGARAWRVRTPDEVYGVRDAIQGHFAHNLQDAVGDFIIKRADGPFAYQLAVVVDDAAQGVTHVVRGADLLDNAPRQIFLQYKLGLPTPQYAHVPTAVDRSGLKLSKSTGAAALDLARPALELVRALHCLGQEPPPGSPETSVQDFLQWSITSWRLRLVPQQLTVQAVSRSERSNRSRDVH